MEAGVGGTVETGVGMVEDREEFVAVPRPEFSGETTAVAIDDLSELELARELH